MQLEMEKVDKGPPFTAAAAKVGPSLGMGYVTPAFAAPWSTLLYVIILEQNWTLHLQT